jgi:hypothetical protein
MRDITAKLREGVDGVEEAVAAQQGLACIPDHVHHVSEAARHLHACEHLN